MYLEQMIYYVRLQEDVVFLPWTSDRGAKLRELRERNHLTRAEMSDRLKHLENASQRYLIKLEVGTGAESAKAIETNLFVEICKLLDVDPSEFGYGVLAQPRRHQ